MPIWETSGNQSEYELIVDANELMGFDLQDSAVRQLGEAIVRRIVDRTQGGLDVDGRTQRPSYSQAYKDSFEFQALGKTNRVNLTLLGSMMGLLSVKNVDRQIITIGWNDSTENAKGFNHNTGDTLPRREFLGLSPADERRLRREFRDFRVTRSLTLTGLFNAILGN